MIMLLSNVKEHVKNIVLKVAEHAELKPPKVVIFICSDSTVKLGGFCSMVDKKICVEFYIPVTFDFKVGKHQLTMVTIHEMCHYMHANTLSVQGQKEDLTRYFNDAQYRNYDEVRTWKATKTTAQELGLWTQPFATAFANAQYVGKPANI